MFSAAQKFLLDITTQRQTQKDARHMKMTPADVVTTFEIGVVYVSMDPSIHSLTENHLECLLHDYWDRT